MIPSIVNFVYKAIKKVIQLSALKLNLHGENETLCVGNLQHQQPSLSTHWDYLSFDDRVQEFHAVIGEDREMVHIGDFVELSSSHYEEVVLAIYIYCRKLSLILYCS